MANPRTSHSLGSTHDVEATIIGADITVVGRIDGQEDLRVRGRVEGSIRLSETLYVDAEGVVQADVEARDVVVAGVLIGNVTASSSVTLEAGARLVGNLRAPRLIIADGAGFRGEVEMGRGGEGASASSQSAARPMASRVPTNVRSAARPAAAAPAPTRAPAPARAAESSGARAAARPTPSAEPARAAAPPAASSTSSRDEDQTLIIRHAALSKSADRPAEATGRDRSEETSRVNAQASNKGASERTGTAARSNLAPKKGVGGRIPRGKHRAGR